jgi:ankyrin repeat protein
MPRNSTVTAKDNDGVTSLIRAAAYGHEGVVSLLLENWSDVGEINNAEAPALHWAAQQGHEAIVRRLIESGAHVYQKTAKPNGHTVLHQAAMSGNESIVRLLLERGLDPDTQNYQGSTALAEVAVRGHDVVVRLLMERGANVKMTLNRATGKERTTVLHLAARQGWEGVVRMFLAERRVEVDSKNSTGMTALQLAISNKHETVTRLLIEHRAKANQEYITSEGRTVSMLHLAAATGHEGITRLLLANGADIGAKTGAGGKAVDVARKHGHAGVVRLLNKYERRKSRCRVM